MWMPNSTDAPHSSFLVPIPDPGVDPDAAPYCTFVVSQEWVPALLGAIKQLVSAWTWDMPPGPTLDLLQQRAQKLDEIFCSCGESGPLPALQITPDGRLQYAADGATWTDLERHAPVPVSAARPWPGADDTISNASGFTGILNAPDGDFLRSS